MGLGLLLSVGSVLLESNAIAACSGSIGCADIFSRLGSLFLFVFPYLVLLLPGRFSGAYTCFCSPPQVWHIEMLHAKHLREVLQLV